MSYWHEQLTEKDLDDFISNVVRPFISIHGAKLIINKRKEGRFKEIPTEEYGLNGVCFYRKSKIVIYIPKYKGHFQSRINILFAALHELGHYYHYLTGLFRNNYDANSELTDELRVAYRAELHCDNFARKILKEFFLYNRSIKSYYDLKLSRDYLRYSIIEKHKRIENIKDKLKELYEL